MSEETFKRPRTIEKHIRALLHVSFPMDDQAIYRELCNHWWAPHRDRTMGQISEARRKLASCSCRDCRNARAKRKPKTQP